MKKFLVGLVLLALPVFGQDQRSGNFTYSYDVASTTATFCVLDGQGGDPFGGFIEGRGQIETSGSSVTVTGVNAADDVFTDIGVGDVLLVQLSSGVNHLRVVTAKASADQVTVESAIDLSDGHPWRYKKLRCGTGVDDGWINTSGWDTVQLTVLYVAGDLGTLDIAMFCKENAIGSGAVRVYPGPSSDCGDGVLSGTVCQFSTPGQGISYKIPNSVFGACRVSLAYGTSDGGTRENITTTISLGR